MLIYDFFKFCCCSAIQHLLKMAEMQITLPCKQHHSNFQIPMALINFQIPLALIILQ